MAPNYADALNNLAGLQLSSGDFLDALGTIQRLLKINPRSAQAYCNLGILMSAAGDSHSGEIAVRNAITLGPRLAQGPLPFGQSVDHRRQVG